MPVAVVDPREGLCTERAGKGPVGLVRAQVGLEVRHSREGLVTVGYGAWVPSATIGGGFLNAFSSGLGRPRAAAALVTGVGFVLLVDVGAE